MAIHAVDKTLVQFLNPNEQTIYKIPVYQREYSWKVVNCQALISDILENDPNYFLGSIIWITSTNEIIDGQQRLTSLNLLLLALYNKLSEYDLANNEDLFFMANSLKRMLAANGQSRIVPQKQCNNKNDFEYLIQHYILKQPSREPSSFKNRKVARNFNCFWDCVKDKDIDQLKELYKKICSLTFISAEVDEQQAAFTLFETMNNRGLPLSAIDLIKSSYMRETKDSSSNWGNLISILGNEANQEQFLRNNYNAFRKEYNNINVPITRDTKYELASKATKSNVIKIYNEIIRRQHNFMEFLTTNAKFNSLLTGEESPQIEVSDKLQEVFKDFRNANATSSFIILLFLLRNQTPYGFSDEQLLCLFRLTLKFFIRRNLTNSPATGAIPQILMDIITEINMLQEVRFKDVYDILYNTFVNKTSSDEIVREILQGDIYDTNRDMARYLLCSLCTFDRSNERKYIDLWDKGKNGEKYIWTIEHIMPEGNEEASNTPACWKNMIREEEQYSQYTDKNIIELVKKYRHKFGNLTMTGYNSNLGNKSFNEKKNRKDANGQPIGYNNGLSLNEDVFSKNTWHIEDIIKRTKSIVEQIMAELKITYQFNGLN